MLWLTGEESRRATEIEGKLFARRMSVRRAKQTRHGFRERNVTDHIMTDLHLFWVGTCGHSPSPWFCLSLQCCRILVKRSSPGTVGRSLQLDLDDLDSGPKSGYPYTRMVRYYIMHKLVPMVRRCHPPSLGSLRMDENGIDSKRSKQLPVKAQDQPWRNVGRGAVNRYLPYL